MTVIRIEAFVAEWARSPQVPPSRPGRITARLEALLRDLLEGVGEGFRREGGIATRDTAIIEAGAVLKPLVVVGAGCFIAAARRPDAGPGCGPGGGSASCPP